MIAKEIRALVPVWAAAAAALWAVSLDGSPLAYAGAALYIIAVAAIGAFSVGHEYAYGTMGYALSLPVPRRRIWLTKLAVLLPMVAALAVLAAWRVDLDRGDRALGPALFWVPALAACSVAPWLTLLTRRPLAGTVFTVGLVGGSMALGEWIGIYRYGYTQEVDAFRVAFVCWSIGLLSAAGAVAGWRTFARLEAQDDRGADVQLLAFDAAVAPSAPVRRRHPLAALLLKELRLQQLAIILVAIYAAAGIVALLVAGAAPLAFSLLSVTTAFYIFVMPAVIGSLAMAEEHQFGTHDAQLLLPVTASRQWLVKTAVALGLTALFVVALPPLLIGFVPRHVVGGVGTLRLGPPTFMLALGGASICLYVSTVVRSAVSALLVALGVILAVIFFMMTAMTDILTTAYEAVHRLTADHPLHRLPTNPLFWAVPLVLFVALVWRCGLTNYRYADRSLPRVAGHALIAAAFLAACGAAAGAIMGMN